MPATSFGRSFLLPHWRVTTLYADSHSDRPETVESLFIAWRLTGDSRYRDYGWSIFEAIETHCRVETGGYASILNVDELPVTHEDKMETFLMVSVIVRKFLAACAHYLRRARRSNTCTCYSRTTPSYRYLVSTSTLIHHQWK